MFDIEIKLLMLAMRSDDLTVMNLKMTLLDGNWPCRETCANPLIRQTCCCVSDRTLMHFLKPIKPRFLVLETCAKSFRLSLLLCLIEPDFTLLDDCAGQCRRTFIYYLYLAVSTTHPFFIIASYFASFNIIFSIFYMFSTISMLSCSAKPPSTSTSYGSCNTAFRHCLKLRPPPTNSRSCDIAQNSWLAHAKPLCQCHPGLVQLSNFSQRAQYTALIFLSPQVFSHILWENQVL